MNSCGAVAKRPGRNYTSKYKKKSQDADNPDSYCTDCGDHISVNRPVIGCSTVYIVVRDGILECAGMIGKSKKVQEKFICELCNWQSEILKGITETIPNRISRVQDAPVINI